MKLHELIREMEHVIPLTWALPDDPVGLQIGDPQQEIQRVFVTLEINSKRMQKAARHQADLLLLHHPLLFRPLKKLIETNPVERLARDLIRNGMACYGMHTNIDLHPEGMAKTWANRLGCKEASCLAPKPQAAGYKIVTFLPEEFTHKVRTALSAAGAGQIGEYSLCSYTSKGTGSFQGSERSNPFTGQAGNFETAAEDRLEMILPHHRKPAVIKALFDSHPYDEPAFDLYPLQDFKGLEQAVWIAVFEKSLSWTAFENRVKKSVKGLSQIQSVRPNPKRKIKTIALSTGSGSSFLPIVTKLNVDCYLTGEMNYHVQWEAHERGMNVVMVGHDYSESMFSETVVQMLKPRISGIQWIQD